MIKVLELSNINLIYQTLENEIEAIKDLSFTLEENTFLSIIGPSGCGKTSILSMIAGEIEQTSGRIIVNGNEKIEKSNLGYMLQNDNLFPWRTIEKNVYLPLEIQKKLTKVNKDYAVSLLDKYGLKEFKKMYPDQLSGGMRQRVALIRTLCSKPSLLLLDEPFSALDYQTRLSVCDDVYKIIKSEKKSAILVTHDISEAISMSDIIIVLTNRPASVKQVFIPQIHGDSPIKKRESPEFSIWFEKIWKELC